MPKSDPKVTEGAKRTYESDPDKWFDNLNADLNKKTEEVLEHVDEETSKKVELNRIFISDFWRLWNKFNEFNIHFVMEPSHSSFAIFEEFPTKWKFRNTFDFSSVSTIQLMDRTQEEGRVGDSLKIWYYTNEAGIPGILIVFEFCEGEHYYKYSGWKRIYSQYTLYESPLSEIDMDAIHNMFGDVMKAWFESHLKHSRDIIIGYIKETYPKREGYSK
ncbi:MAG: hypothetical protein M1481_00660 [Candidatus Thermoplasmatota archaeon]|jgi:hypothetical protein|nr:hypothetical protein [Candidatus Thermoplasmatota archaeon]MCL5963494.1 hypothetical protein [Candidatus Thermoplasmatota archaeon]